MEEQKFLIVIPTYNRKHLLPTLLGTIYSQSYEKFQVLFVDDCSTDGTESFLRDEMNKHPEIDYFRMGVNSGVNAVRSKIVDIASQKYPESFLVFIDDDDLLAENALNTANEEINRNPGYNWYTMDCVTPAGKPISRIKKYGELSYIDDYMFGRGIKGDLTHIVRAESIPSNTRFATQFRNAEVWYFWSKLSQTQKLFAIPKVGSIKDYLPEGITQSGFNRDKSIEVAYLKINTLEPLVGTKKLRHQYTTLAKWMIDTGQPDEAARLLKTVFSHSPLYHRQYRHWLKLLGAKLRSK